MDTRKNILHYLILIPMLALSLWMMVRDAEVVLSLYDLQSIIGFLIFAAILIGIGIVADWISR